jgi:rod shape-determining protein MreC
MARRRDRQAMAMALVLLGATGVAVLDRAAAPAEDLATRALAPILAVLHATGGRVEASARGSRDVATLRAKVDALQQANAEMEMANLKTGDLVNEVTKLRELLKFANERVDLDLRGASVVGRKIAEEPGNLLHTIKVDLGRDDGVAPGAPVATERGLVGRIDRSGSSWSDVLLITDPRSAIIARIERTRATGVVFGTPSGELRMRYVPQDAEGQPNVQVGDVVFTTGLSNQFPAMIPIGQVVEIAQRDVATHQEAVVRPSVDVDQLEFVMVVTGFQPIPEDEP